MIVRIKTVVTTSNTVWVKQRYDFELIVFKQYSSLV